MDQGWLVSIEPNLDSKTDWCLVLDIDETCVHSTEDFPRLQELGIFKNPNLMDLRRRTYCFHLEDVIEPRGTGQVTPIWGVMRPHLKTFLAWAQTHFRKVAIWTAGQPKYAEKMVDEMFRDLSAPVTVYSFPQCHNNHSVIEKPLSQMFSDPNLKMSPEKTLVIDDRLTTFANVNPNNGILIPAYKPNLNLDPLMRDDTALLELQAWCERPEVMSVADVRTLNKSQIFSAK